MADISKITLPSGTTYNIKDQTARDLISNLDGYTDYLGVTTTALTDGATTNPISVDGSSITAKKGNIVNYGSKEFIFNGTAWQEFGDMSGLKALAYKDNASASYTPAGAVTQPTFTGTAATITSKGTPAGTVSKPSWTGTAATITVTGTPAGTVSKPNVTVTPSTTTVNSITAVGSLPTCTLPTLTTTVANENLTLGWTEGSFNAGSLPTKGSNTTVMTGASAALASNPTFTGAALSSTTAYTPAGSVSQPTFSGAVLNSTVSYTPAGTVSKPTFSGTAATITVS